MKCFDKSQNTALSSLSVVTSKIIHKVMLLLCQLQKAQKEIIRSAEHVPPKQNQFSQRYHLNLKK